MCLSQFIPGQESVCDVSLWLLGVSVNVLSLFITTPRLPPLLPPCVCESSQCEWAGEIALLRTQLWNWNWSPGSIYWLEQTRISCRSSSSHNPALGSHQLFRSRYSDEQHENPFTFRTEIFRGPTWKSIHRSQVSNSEKTGNVKFTEIDFGAYQIQTHGIVKRSVLKGAPTLSLKLLSACMHAVIGLKNTDWTHLFFLAGFFLLIPCWWDLRKLFDFV